MSKQHHVFVLASLIGLTVIYRLTGATICEAIQTAVLVEILTVMIMRQEATK